MTDLAALYARHVAHLTDGYHRALDATGYDAVVVHAGRLTLKSPFDDLEWPFRPVPAFEHWAEVRWPDSAVVVRKGEAPALLALRSTSFWERPAEPDFDTIRRGLEVVEIQDFAKVQDHLPKGGKIGFVSHHPEAAEALGLTAEAFVPRDLMDALEDLRVHKTDYEIACLAEANRVAARGHVAIRDAFLAGLRSELDLHLSYLLATEQDDADTPYKSIVALGRNGAVLHHNVYGTDEAAGSLLVDAGARHRNLNADITRTTAGEDESADRFRDLVDRMDDLQQALVAAVRPGLPYEDLHDLAHEKLGQLLVDAKLATVSAEAAVETGLTRVLFPHGLGHSLGVQVHDVACRRRDPKPTNPFLRMTRTLAEGMVFTIEPGLYFIDHLLQEAKAGAHADALDWAAVEALAPFGGIRIEDDVHVTAEGTVRNFSREAFAALEADDEG